MSYQAKNMTTTITVGASSVTVVQCRTWNGRVVTSQTVTVSPEAWLEASKKVKVTNGE